ncbi:hypothetical protein CMU70_18515 [Elizabethkingia anophelis]|nr:hypothetical protein [Elizabethkingia anophelis]
MQLWWGSDSALEWTSQECAFLRLIPYKLIHGHLLPELFELIGRLDNRLKGEIEKLQDDANGKKINVNSNAFSTVFSPIFNREAGITQIISSLQSGALIFGDKIDFEDELIQELLLNKKLGLGQFYFLMLLLRWDKKLRFLYPYAMNALNDKWRGVPWHLLLEVLNRAARFHQTEEQREKMISALNRVHSQTTNPWVSTEIFEALSAIGALEDDAEKYISIVVEDIDQLLLDQESESNWKKANTLYNSQFDHPFDKAFQTAIYNLNIDKKVAFLQMALKGVDSIFFGTPLLIDAVRVLKEKVCPLIVKWTDAPNLRPFPGEALKMFIVSHLILAKYNHPLPNRVLTSDDLGVRSLLAGAELYYWANRSDLKNSEIRNLSSSAEAVLFDPLNIHTIDVICKLTDQLHQSSIHLIYENVRIRYIEEFCKQAVINTCHIALQNLDWQKSIEAKIFDSDMNTHAIHLLGKIGSVMDVDVLRIISDHPKYGEFAVKAIKKLYQSTHHGN